MTSDKKQALSSMAPGDRATVDAPPVPDTLQSYPIEFQPILLEEAVLRAIDGHPEERAFRQQRDRIYELADAEERGRDFQQLHERWFERLGLKAPLLQTLSEWPLLAEKTDRCLVIQARSKKDVCVELYRSSGFESRSKPETRTILVQTTADLLCRPNAFLAFLRHEMMHVVDMVDPNFGYDPTFPRSESGPAFDHLLQQRYGLIWDITIDGRLCRRGWLPATVREERFKEFQRVFRGHEAEQRKIFRHFFDGGPHTHQELLSFAQRPQAGLSTTGADDTDPGRCALCHFPSHDLIHDPAAVSPGLIQIIRQEVPGWTPSQPICRQCADLFAARQWAHSSE